jgi:hypothetical protein
MCTVVNNSGDNLVAGLDLLLPVIVSSRKSYSRDLLLSAAMPFGRAEERAWHSATHPAHQIIPFAPASPTHHTLHPTQWPTTNDHATTTATTTVSATAAANHAKAAIEAAPPQSAATARAVPKSAPPAATRATAPAPPSAKTSTRAADGVEAHTEEGEEDEAGPVTTEEQPKENETRDPTSARALRSRQKAHGTPVRRPRTRACPACPLPRT